MFITGECDVCPCLRESKEESVCSVRGDFFDKIGDTWVLLVFYFRAKGVEDIVSGRFVLLKEEHLVIFGVPFHGKQHTLSGSPNYFLKVKCSDIKMLY